MLSMLRRYLNIWVLLGTVAIALLLLCVMASALWFIRPEAAPTEQATAVFNVIPYSTPTSPPATQTPVPTQPVAGGEIPPAPPPGQFTTGSFVEVTGTGGDGLRLRSEPGLEGEVLFLGLEGEIFRVEDGPVMLDNYSWWLLVAPYDENVKGWGVSNFLKAVQNP